MVIKEGYKQTEIGLIPNEWEVKNIGDVCQIFGRIGFRGYTVNDIVKKEQGAITISPSNIYGDKINFAKCTYISWFKYHESPEIKIYNGDVLLVKTGSTSGKTALVKNLNEKATINPQLVVLKKILINNFLLSYIMSYDIVQNQIISTIVGGAIPTLSQKQVLSFKIPLAPSLAEQSAIANALSDADGLITGLEKLITKKRNIKQGAMQQLLQPKDGWEVKKLGEVGKCIRGVSYNPERDLHSHDKNNTSRLLRSNNIKNRNLDFNNLQFVNIDRVKTHQFLQKGDIVICMANGSKQLVGKSAIFNIKDNIKYTFGAFMGCFRTDKKIASSSFIAVNFQTFQYRCYIDVLLSGSSINNLNPSNIESIEIPFPPIAEQTRIASILSDMDAELSVLVQKLEKYKKVKLGMMQELLTGKTRLV